MGGVEGRSGVEVGQSVTVAGMATPLASERFGSRHRWLVSLTRAHLSQGRSLRAGSRDALPGGAA
ncbi:hypothetical protein GCM10027074_38020 [Streptomyces deserti]